MRRMNGFRWNVWVWGLNGEGLRDYDVVPHFTAELASLPKSRRPRTRDEMDDFLRAEAMRQYWARCEYEMVVHGWVSHGEDRKVDVYDQLRMNWDSFVDAFWDRWATRKMKEGGR